MMSLAVLVDHPTGSHPASWLHPDTNPAGSTDIEYFRGIAQLAEQGKFDLYFVADTPAARTDNLHAWSRFPMYMNVLEPVTLLTALAGATSRIGLGGTVSTSFAEPYNVARQFASLDHISQGRAAWNVVTSANDYAARNFGHTALAPHGERYERAGEFVDVVRKLWDTWDEDAFVRDRTTGIFFDPARQHQVHHDGKFFKVHGALNIARAPQGPVRSK
jgi:N-acetyl-S-(2-succino)cysteine monooxygenase